jgi:hypothetical protein
VIVAVENVGPTEAEITPDAITDPQRLSDITGALGTLKRSAANSLSWHRKLRLLLVIIGSWLDRHGRRERRGRGPGLRQMGQDYGMKLLWTLILLFPILFFCQEMVVRLGAVSGVGNGGLIFNAQSGERNP